MFAKLNAKQCLEYTVLFHFKCTCDNSNDEHKSEIVTMILFLHIAVYCVHATNDTLGRAINFSFICVDRF